MCHPSEYADPDPIPGSLREEVAVPVVGGPDLPARLCVPAGNTRGAALIVTDIFGANAFYRAIADRLAARGFAALLPDLFFREGRLAEPTRELAYERRAKLDDGRTLHELVCACDWLRGRAAIADGRLGTIGFCLGGNLALHLAARRNDLATVAYYAFPAGLPAPKAAPPPQEVVARLQGPILAFWGDRDDKVGMPSVHAFERCVRDARVDYEQSVYPGCDHGFLAGIEDANHEAHAAAIDSWQRTLDFFGSRLGGASA